MIFSQSNLSQRKKSSGRLSRGFLSNKFTKSYYFLFFKYRKYMLKSLCSVLYLLLRGAGYADYYIWNLDAGFYF